MKKSFSSTRRDFIKNAGIAGGLLLLPASVLGRTDKPSANNRLRVAAIGVGGQGWGDLNRVASTGADIVALCDVDSDRLARAAKEFPKAKTFADYRVLFDKIAKEIDAVIISTPDHTHFTIAMTAMMLGKHVYLQKPMAHTIDQCFRLAEAAEKYKVVTQMGNQGHSEDHIRYAKEWYDAGLFGEISEVTTWTNRPGDWWPQGINSFQTPGAERGKRDADPSKIDWDLWLGPVKGPEKYVPGLAHFNWRGYYAFGTGAIGDMAVHIFDPANYILDLGFPTKVEVKIDNDIKPTPVTYPKGSTITYYYPATDKRGPVKLTWKDGGNHTMPKAPDGIEKLIHDGGSIFHGKDATAVIGAWGNSFEVAGGQTRFNELREKAPKRYIERIKGGHYKNWTTAILEGKQATSHFGYAAPFTAAILVGSIAQRLGRTVEWDPQTRQFKGDAEANALIKAASARDGFLA